MNIRIKVVSTSEDEEVCDVCGASYDEEDGVSFSDTAYGHTCEFCSQDIKENGGYL